MLALLHIRESTHSAAQDEILLRRCEEVVMRRSLFPLVASLAATLFLFTGCGSDSNSSLNDPLNPYNQLSYRGCVQLNYPLSFTGYGTFTSSKIQAGRIPSTSGSYGQTIGYLTLGGGTALQTTGAYSRSGTDGTINVNINQSGYGTGVVPQTGGGAYPYPAGVNTPNGAQITGNISISQNTIQDIVYQFGGNNSYNPYPVATPYAGNGYTPNTYPYSGGGYGYNSPCVSEIAIDVQHYNNVIHSGFVYLYINNSGHGYTLYF